MGQPAYLEKMSSIRVQNRLAHKSQTSKIPINHHLLGHIMTTRISYDQTNLDSLRLLPDPSKVLVDLLKLYLPRILGFINIAHKT